MLLRTILLARLIRKFRVLFLVLIAILIAGIIFTYTWQPDMHMCFMDIPDPTSTTSTGQPNDANTPKSLEDVLQAEPKPTPGRSIFFHETSCRQSDRATPQYSHYNILHLTPRQACAIESAALHNPSFQIFVLFAGPTYRANNNNSNQPLIDAILSYKNVHLRRLNLWSYAANTPIEEWLNDGQLFRSKYLFSHVSDFLRYLTLYRYGGIYLDMDVIMLRSMEDVPPNFTGAESNTHLAAGVMSLAHDGFGHEIADLCLRDLQHNFDGYDWGNNGPGVITRVAQKICATKDISVMVQDRKRCMGFQVFDRSAFYAIPWKQWEHFFDPKFLTQTNEITKDSYVVHVWNKHSKDLPVKVGSNVAYGKYAELHCPKSYAASGEYF